MEKISLIDRVRKEVL